MIVLEASQVVLVVKNSPASAEDGEMSVLSLGWEDPWRRVGQPTLVFLPGEVNGHRSPVGYSPWGRRESDTTELLALSLSFT